MTADHALVTEAFDEHAAKSIGEALKGLGDAFTYEQFLAAAQLPEDWVAFAVNEERCKSA